MTSVLMSNMLLAGAFRKSPCGKIDAAGDPKLLGIGVEDAVIGGVEFISIGGGPDSFPFLVDFDAFLEEGLMKPLRAFIVKEVEQDHSKRCRSVVSKACVRTRVKFVYRSKRERSERAMGERRKGRVKEFRHSQRESYEQADLSEQRGGPSRLFDSKKYCLSDGALRSFPGIRYDNSIAMHPHREPLHVVAAVVLDY
jgi:hypothetical protein